VQKLGLPIEEKMKAFLKWTSISVFVVAVLLATAITATIGWRPILGPKYRSATNRKFESTPQRLARGRYLMTSVSGCFGCHSEHDWKSHGAPVVPGTEGAGEVMPLPEVPGTVVAPNITSDVETGVGGWSDDELARAIREGVDRNGRTLFPMMPYERYRTMADEDLASIIVYMRTIPPIRRQLAQSEIIFPVKYLVRSAPEPVTQPVSSDAAQSTNPVIRGAYLLNIAGCADCHTPDVRGVPVAGMDFAGGAPRNGPWGTVSAANITPDDSGIKYYDEALFIQTMRTGYVRARELKPIMPYWIFGQMTDNDLKAVFAYLRTLKPVHHRVDNSETATLCKLCRQKHGAGDQN
jgi:mono/diheme cytochrome c family protein